MTDNKHLATTQQQQVSIPSADQLTSMLSFAENAVKSGLLPSHIKTPQAAFAIIQMGQELRIPPMAALRGIYVIGGKPTCDAAMMQALIYRDHGDNALIPVESTAEKCTYRFKRANWPEYQEYTYSKEDAQKAGLWGNKGPWSTFPRDMLRSRCISVIARMAFQDTVSGLYTFDEMGADVSVSPDGEMHIVDTSPRDDSPSSPDVPLSPPPAELESGIPGEGPELASDKQIKLISKLTHDAGYTDESLKKIWLSKYGVESRKDLNKGDASQLINDLKAAVIAKDMKAATDERELNIVGAKVKEEDIQGRALKQLRELYQERLADLTSSDGDEELDEAFEAHEASQVEMA